MVCSSRRGALFIFLLGMSIVQSGFALSNEVVDLQLRWHHQFQFAGYYAALEKGYYKEEGLDVRLHAGDPEHQPVQEVLSGRAQYAEGNSEVLFQRLQGKPLVALASIFQHSPSVLLVRKDSGINSVHDLIGKKVMLMNGSNDADFMTMFQNEGVALAQVDILPSSYNFEDLISRKVDAFNSYLTNEPFFLKQRNIPYHVINPASYGVDFYSDILFTSESELGNHPERVEAMRRATLRGWRYAMDNPEEIIDLLINKYHVEKTREHLKFEAAEMRNLIFPDLIEMGLMNPARWEHMANAFVKAGFVKPGYSLDGFIYDASPRQLPKWVLPLMLVALVVIVIILLVSFILMRANRSLAIAKAELHSANENLSLKLQQIGELNQRIHEQAIRDSLTGLYNRRYLDEMLEREISRAKREGYRISLAIIDLDHFKSVNDTYGHQVGDQVLQRLAELLIKSARDGDIACRYGGEEFVLVLPRLSAKDAFSRAEEWRHAFAEGVTRHGDLEIRSTMSVGLAAYPDHAAHADELINTADVALYKAKSNGRNRIEVATEIQLEIRLAERPRDGISSDVQQQ